MFSQLKYKINFLTINELPRHLSWADVAFSEKRFRDILDVIVGFNIDNASDVNKLIDSKKSNIQKIREDVINGTIIKERKSDGTYIWKKIRK